MLIESVLKRFDIQIYYYHEFFFFFLYKRTWIHPVLDLGGEGEGEGEGNLGSQRLHRGEGWGKPPCATCTIIVNLHTSCSFLSNLRVPSEISHQKNPASSIKFLCFSSFISISALTLLCHTQIRGYILA